MLRWLVILLVVAGLAAGVVYVVAGRGAPPEITIAQPGEVLGRAGTLEVIARAPDARLTTLDVRLEQNGASTPLFSLGNESGASVQTDGDQVRITRPIGAPEVPALTSGAARIVVEASRPSIWDLRTLSASAAKDVRVRLEPPRVAVLSTFHYLNHGGAELVIYRATPPDVESGVRVGDLEYRGFPASGAGVATSDPTLKAAFFALLPEQDLNTRITLFARDEAGNEARGSSFVDRVFPKSFRKSRIPLDDRFLERVVPDILDQTPELKVENPADLLASFLRINGDLRRMNNDRISTMTAQTSPTRLWEGPFAQLGNSQVEAGFADFRTYVYQNREVDRQVHLGYDLAATAAVPIVAANTGKVLHAGWLGIYGNCVVIDHGLGVSSLYGHLSSIDVKEGDAVRKGQTVGRSGMTGLAGGDHLHFTMLVNGRPVNPVEWWDPQWNRDRVERKLAVRYD
jgi:murein DD-endopeptidase MepM/ murein hydrolase activator NlpD